MGNASKKWLLMPVVALVLAATWLRPIDSIAERHVDAGLQSALITFAAARGLNGVLSLAQGIQVGAGASFHPGAILEPLDDLVEQFSGIMLAASLSFAVQRILLEGFSSWPVSAALT